MLTPTFLVTLKELCFLHLPAIIIRLSTHMRSLQGACRVRAASSSADPITAAYFSGYDPHTKSAPLRFRSSLLWNYEPNQPTHVLFKNRDKNFCEHDYLEETNYLHRLCTISTTTDLLDTSLFVLPKVISCGFSLYVSRLGLLRYQAVRPDLLRPVYLRPLLYRRQLTSFSSGKLRTLLYLLKKHYCSKIILIVSNSKTLDLLEGWLGANGRKWLRMDHTHHPHHHYKKMVHFNAAAAPTLLLLSSKIMGPALLPAVADVIVHFETEW
jgi:hypothetical protein